MNETSRLRLHFSVGLDTDLLVLISFVGLIKNNTFSTDRCWLGLVDLRVKVIQ